MLPLIKLLSYKRWSNNLLYDSVSSLSSTQLVQPQKIIFGSLINTLYHTYQMDEVWQAHLQGTQHNITHRIPHSAPDFCALRLAQQAIDNWYLDYARELSTKAYSSQVKFSFLDGSPGEMTRFDILMHVVNHGTYHRGHIASMLYEMGYSPPTTDYPVFLAQTNNDKPDVETSNQE